MKLLQKQLPKLLVILGGVFFMSFTLASATSTFITQQGGTGTTSPSGILYGDNGATNHLNTVTIGSNLTFSGGTLSTTGGGSFPFTPTTNFNQVANATTTQIWFQGSPISLSASSTAEFSYSTTTFATLKTIWVTGFTAGAPYFDSTGQLFNHATTSASVANQDVWRDANQNAFAQNFISAATTFPSAGTTNTLLAASPRIWIITGTKVQTLKLPIGTTLSNGTTYVLNDNSTGAASTTDNSGNLIGYVLPGGSVQSVLYDNSTSNGSWDAHGWLGHSVYSGSNSLSIGSTSPFAELSIHSNANDSVAYTTLFAIGSSTASATTTLFKIDNTGAVTTSLGTGCVNSTNGLLSVSGSGCTSGTVTSIATNNGITGGTITSSGTIGLATINAGVLGAVTNGAVPTSQATSTLYGVAPAGGYVLGWNNNTSGIGWIATSTSGGGIGDPFTHTTYSGVNVSATSSPVWFTATSPFSLIASSTYSTFASTTMLTVDNLLAGDALTQYGAANHEWVTGAKSSDFTFRISSSTTLGTSDVFKADKSLNVFFPNLTSNGFVKTSGGTGQLSIDTNTYLTSIGSGTNGQVAYWSGTNTLAGVGTTTPTLGIGLTGTLTTINNVAQSLSIATSSLYSGTTGQLPYFSGTNTITATSSLFLAASGNFGVASSTPGFRFSVNDVGSEFYVSSTGEIVGRDVTNNWNGRISPTQHLTFNIATSTGTWTATSTSGVDVTPTQPAKFTGVVRGVQCPINTFLGIILGNGTATTTYFIASSTVGYETVSLSITKGQKLTMLAGTTTTATAASGVVNGSCTWDVTETP